MVRFNKNISATLLMPVEQIVSEVVDEHFLKSHYIYQPPSKKRYQTIAGLVTAKKNIHKNPAKTIYLKVISII
ncbi:MAG: hypothetical protein IPP49_17390 [Saprospiraceae bacterium]|nr:hypothetical protein [Saprospiraceae bacterium]